MSTVFSTGLPATGALTLLRCEQCGHINYPPRELCGHCLADALEWQAVPATGVIQSLVQLHYSLEPVYAAHLPWSVASVKLDCGPVVLAHLPPGLEPDARVNLRPIEDRAGNRMLLAAAADGAHATETAEWLASVNFKEVSI